MKLSDIAGLVNGKITGNSEVEITSVGKIEFAGPHEITFIANPVYEKYYRSTKAGAIIVSKRFKPPEKRDVSLVVVDDPYLAFLDLLEHFSPKTELQEIGISASAVITESAEISKEEVRIGANCFIGEKCRVGRGVRILPNTVILAGSEIGDDVLIYPNVTVYQDTKIGERVIIHAGSVIGSDGFGQARNEDGTYKKIPQKGIVVIEDDVEIGSNCTIDRATLGETLICRGVKMDNQIQVAHNVIIGDNTVIAAQAGIAGSTKIGKNCIIGGKVGIVGHIEICDNVTITAAANVSKSITRPGVYSGYRAQPQKEELKQQARLKNIANLKEDIQKKKKK
jgi:UDP-3-O-[3-hydroxymyristoyl] glucosamine N-acyltransferase